MRFSGGYFLTRTVERAAFMAADLLPDRLLSLSDCICDFAPSHWAIQWVNVTDEERAAEASKFEVSPSRTQDIVDRATEWLDTGRLGWPSVFFSLQDAREFSKRFLDNCTDLELVGISLHEECVDPFLREERPPADQGEPGIYTAVGNRRPLEPGGRAIGWEVLCYDHGGFHSWLCNGLEVAVAESCKIKPGKSGLIDDANDALAAASYCGRADVGAEPGFWAPLVARKLRGRDLVTQGERPWIRKR